MDVVVTDAAPTSDSDQFIISRRILNMYLTPAPEQRSEEWFRLRGQKITGSIVDAVIKGKTAYTTRDRLMLEKAGMPSVFVGNVATRFGTLHEDNAVALFERRTGFRVIPMGLVLHPECPLLAHSPDGIALRPGLPPALIEIKCPFRRAFENDTQIYPDYLHQCMMVRDQAGM